jgi:hypothetical protein
MYVRMYVYVCICLRKKMIYMRGDRNEREGRGSDNIHMWTCATVCVSDFDVQ